MSMLDKVATMRVEDYDPVIVVEAVNALQPLGQAKALEAIDAYLAARRKGESSPGLFWLLRVLFDVPAGAAFPPVRLGQPDVAPPASVALLPRFPIVIVDDVPLLVVSGYMLGGLPEPVESHVAYFRAHGVIRAAPLAPAAATADVEADFARVWRAAYGADAPDVSAHVRAQLARRP